MADKSAIFVIVVDAAATPAVREAVLRYVLDSRDFEDVFTGYPGFVLVKSELSAQALRSKLKVFTGETTFLVAAINPAAFDGWLPIAAFKWVAKHKPPPPPTRSRRTLN